jgi:hypothetical protein
MNLLVSPRSRPLYDLELAEPLVTPFCKGKYFELKVRLISAEVPPTILEVLLYTSDVPPRKIVHNMTGGQTLRGEKRPLWCTLKCPTCA